MAGFGDPERMLPSICECLRASEFDIRGAKVLSSNQQPARYFAYSNRRELLSTGESSPARDLPRMTCTASLERLALAFAPGKVRSV